MQTVFDTQVLNTLKLCSIPPPGKSISEFSVSPNVKTQLAVIAGKSDDPSQIPTDSFRGIPIVVDPYLLKGLCVRYTDGTFEYHS